jgi:iron complex transport system substrate-binding protein
VQLPEPLPAGSNLIGQGAAIRLLRGIWLTRIVSLLPSATEIVCALGFGNELVGVSHECDFPPEVTSKPKIIESVFDTTRVDSERIDSFVVEHLKRGESLYRINIDELKRANPSLIITQELCDVCAIGASDVLAAANQMGKPVNVLSLNPHSLKDIEDDIRSVAKAIGHPEKAGKLIAELEAKVEGSRKLTKNVSKPRVFCVEWLKPIMNAGHWVPEMVEYAGGIEGLANRGQPSTYIDWHSVMNYDPEVVVLMPCGFVMYRAMEQARHFFDLPGAKRLTAVRNGRVFASDGHNYFSRSGPRLFDGIKILAQMIHPELFNEPLDPKLGSRVEMMQAKF